LTDPLRGVAVLIRFYKIAYVMFCKDQRCVPRLISKGSCVAIPLLIIFGFKMKVASGFSRIRIKKYTVESSGGVFFFFYTL